MDEQTLVTMLRRIDGLERENVRLKRWATFAFVAVAILAIIGQFTPLMPEHIRAKSVELGGWGRRDQVSLWATTHGGGLEIQDGNGKPLISLGTDGPLGPSFRIWDKHNNLLLRFDTDPNRTQLAVSSPNGAASFGAELDDNGDADIGVRDKHGERSLTSR